MNLETFSLKNKVAIITGGNTGIGLGYVEAYAALGADILVTHFDLDITKVQKIARKYKRKIEFWHGNLTKKAAADDVLDFALKKFGRVDVLINNAGTIERAPILEHTLQQWNKVLNINLNVVWKMSQTIAKQMSKQGGGKIINIASMLTFQGGKFVPGYAASKHGVAGLTKAMANELGENNIQVNAIAPGYIISDNTAPIRADAKRNAEIISRIPMGKWGQPSDLMGAAVFLASDASNYITGTILCVDGGWQSR